LKKVAYLALDFINVAVIDVEKRADDIVYEEFV
jgi:hypothetical protein